MPTKASSTASPSVAIYCRISRDHEGNELGVTRQREDCEALAERLGWHVGAILIDDDISAYSGKHRPSYEAMLDALRSGAVQAVIAWHPDRLTRHPRELEDLIDLLEKSGARVATVTAGDYDLATPAGRMVARVVGAVARGESEHKSARLRRQREQAAKMGVPNGGRRPYGYKKGGMELEPVESKRARQAVDRVLAGESVRQIALDFNRRGWLSSSGREWTVTAMRTMLAGPRLAALRVHRGEVIGDAVWPALVTKEEHEKLLAAARHPRERKRGRPPARLLAGLLVCGECGGKLHSSGHTDIGRRYLCGVGASTERCGRVAIAARQLEEIVTEAALTVLDSPAVRRARKSRAARGRRGPDAAAQLAEIESDLEALAEDHGAGRIGRREWIAARDALTARATTLRSELERQVEDKTVATLRGAPHVRAAFAELDTDGQRAVLSTVIDQIVIARAARSSVFDASRIDVRWRA